MWTAEHDPNFRFPIGRLPVTPSPTDVREAADSFVPARNARGTREARNLKSTSGNSNAGNDTGRHVDFGGVMLFSNTSPRWACVK